MEGYTNIETAEREKLILSQVR